MTDDVGSLKVHHWWLWLITGILLIIIGLILLAAPIVTTIASVLFFGVLLIIGGGIHVISALLDRKSNHFWLSLVIAALAFVFGFLMLINPTITLAAITLLIAAFFLSNGFLRIIGSLVSRFRGWGWYLLNGLISLLLGILIVVQWPASSLWVIGLFIGIDFIFAGISLIMISLFAEREFLRG